MARRAAPASVAAALALAAAALWTATGYAALPFLLGRSSLGASTRLPPAELGTPVVAPRAGNTVQDLAPAKASARDDLAGGVFACGCAAMAAVASRMRGRQLSRSATPRRGRLHGLIARRAEEESILGNLGELDRQDEEEVKKVEKEMEEEELVMEFGEDNLEDSMASEEMSAQDAARRGERQIVYNLYPSKNYVLYIAKKNAERYWSKDGPGGPKSNKGCLEVQIAVLTERIRNMVLHVREFSHDYKCRLKLISMVSRRRRLMDKLSWKDLDSYLRVREELKIRHVYRMEVLIGRLPEYKYGIRDRKRAPGRKIIMRLKKSKRLLARRLATQLRQGKPSKVIHKTKKMIKSRKWLARAYDDVSNMVAGQEITHYIDPLNIP
mmetsp:Transcript_39754/g.118954  ORF Transcript_39754/g.118954 Transcript_39754/m.118954 type:complete len:382 (+) Transcript_39754:57-1202(+)